MGYFEDAYVRARDAVACWFEANEPDAEALTWEALKRTGREGSGAGWRFSLSSATWGLLLLSADFPYSLPVVVVEGDEHATAPHVERDGHLCLEGDGAVGDATQPEEMVAYIVGRARKLLQENAAAQHEDDYRSDFSAYWRRHALKISAFTLLTDAAQSREVSGIVERGLRFIAETDGVARAWLSNRFGSADAATHPALVAWLQALPKPAQYPRTVNELRMLAPDIRDRLDELLVGSQDVVLVALRGEAEPGRVAGGIVRLTRADGARFRTNGRKGFRPGRHPPPNLTACAWRLERLVDRPVDAADTRRPPSLGQLTGAQVTIIGCGALGSGVARLLAQSGVRRLRLIDPDSVGFENIGRHELGAAEVGENKAEALAKKLRERLPLMERVEAIPTEWLEAARDKGDTFFEDDSLVISVTADWSAGSALDDFQQRTGMHTPVLHGWMEQNAGAAHALVCTALGPACFRDGFDNLGKPKLPVTRWRSPPEVLGCAAPVSPFGAIELAQAQALVADLAVGVLTKTVEPHVRWVWFSRLARIAAEGGRWNWAWIMHHGDPAEGGLVASVPWPP